jgi:hypothetical protein
MRCVLSLLCFLCIACDGKQDSSVDVAQETDFLNGAKEVLGTDLDSDRASCLHQKVQADGNLELVSVVGRQGMGALTEGQKSAVGTVVTRFAECGLEKAQQHLTDSINQLTNAAGSAAKAAEQTGGALKAKIDGVGDKALDVMEQSIDAMGTVAKGTLGKMRQRQPSEELDNGEMSIAPQNIDEKQ